MNTLVKQLDPIHHYENYLPPLLQQPCQSLSSFLAHAFTTFSNDSVMIIGPGGSGKKHLVRYTLNELRKSCKYSFKSVYIDGSNVSTDAHLLGSVLQELEKCSGMSSSSGSSGIVNESYFPDEESDDNFDEQAKSVEFLKALKNFPNQSLVFVLDGFEILCKYAGKMLYTITDTCHESKLSVIIIGITKNSSIALAMDRRVRSRFSSRKIYTFLPRNASQISQVMEYYLKINNESATTTTDAAAVVEEDTESSIIDLYNTSLKSMLLHPDVVQLLEECVLHPNCSFYYSLASSIFESVMDKIKQLYSPVGITSNSSSNSSSGSMIVNSENEIFTSNIFIQSFLSLVNNRQNERLSSISRLNQCQLILLCAVKKIESLYNSKNSSIDITFDTMYNLYMKFASGGAQSSNIRQEHLFSEGRTQIETDYQIVFQNFISLVELRLIRYITKDFPRNRKEQTTTKVRLSNVHPSQIEHEIERLYNDGKLSTMTPELYEWNKSTCL